jgi:hypothetical protein
MALRQQPVAAQESLDRLDAGLGEDDGAVLLVLLVGVGLSRGITVSARR